MSTYSFEEIDAELGKAIIALRNAMSTLSMDDDFVQRWQELRKKYKPAIVKWHKLYIEQFPVEKLKLSKIDDIGDRFSIEEFKENCECGGFVDDDGDGYLIYKGQQTDLNIPPSCMIGSIDLSKFDGVMWYNK